MLQETISLEKVILAMDAGEVFSLGFRTCNKIKGTGGEYIFYKTVCKHHSQFNDISGDHLTEKKYKRNPNHYKNSTRNIRIIPDGNIVTVHLRLIRQFNSKTIL